MWKNCEQPTVPLWNLWPLHGLYHQCVHYKHVQEDIDAEASIDPQVIESKRKMVQLMIVKIMNYAG
jgi:hypothetical protein